MSIYFLRHIKTYNNVNGVLSGRTETDTLPNQSITLPQMQTHFDVVYSSTAKRCVDTVCLIPKSFLPSKIKYTDILLERSMGILENTPIKEAQEKFPLFFVNGKIDVNSIIPKGETIDELINRVNPLIDIILSSSNKNNCLICSHNQTLKVINAIVNNISITNEYWYNVNFAQGTITKIT